MLKVEGLTKTYPGFGLRDVSFELPDGYIMGFIGMNGAGKSTTLKSILRVTRPDAGKVEIFGLDMAENELEIKQKVGFSLGAFDYYPYKKLKNIAAVYKTFFRSWDDTEYRQCLRRFSLDENKRVNELSAGMKVKFALALALSHGAKLFIFDEPTSGLDPVARDELLELFASLIETGDRSILFSTHITSDLDKCADYITFIKDGRILMCDTKDNIIDAHAIVSGGKDVLKEELLARTVGYKKNSYGFSALIRRDLLTPTDNLETHAPDLEDIAVYYNRGNEQ